MQSYKSNGSFLRIIVVSCSICLVVIQWLNKQLNTTQAQQGSPGLLGAKQNPSPIGISPTYPTARNFAFPPSSATTLANQVIVEAHFDLINTTNSY